MKKGIHKTTLHFLTDSDFAALPIVLAILLYILIYFLRWQQGGWELQLDLFPDLRQALDERISHLLPSPQSELLSGILLGEKKNLPGPLRLALRDTSTLHMVVVSGQNLTLLAGLIMTLAGLLKRRVAISITLLSIIGYTILTGAQIPVLRAAIMAACAYLAQLSGRQKEGAWVLIVVAALLLLINPLWIADLSFQLSFLATAGVVIVAPILLNYFKLPLIGQDLAVTTGAQLMVMPIIIQNFHQLSLVGIVANLLTAWTIPFIMILGSITLLVSFFSQLLAQILAIAVGVLLTYFIYIVQFFSSLPFAWEYVGEKIWIVWVGYYLVLAGILIAIKIRD